MMLSRHDCRVEDARSHDGSRRAAADEMVLSPAQLAAHDSRRLPRHLHAVAE